jgi:hypothetical protein
MTIPTAREGKPKSEFFWASVAGAEPEPVEVVNEGPRRAVYTFGCPDPFYLDDPNCPVVLGSRVQVVAGGVAFSILDTEKPLPLVRPALRETSAAEMARQERNYRKSGPHSWRGPR